MQPRDRLRETIYPARVFAYVLASLILLQLDQRDGYLAGWLAIFLLYPLVPSRTQWLRDGRARRQRLLMLADGLLVGVMISLVDFNLEASAVLLSLLGISVMILGGPVLALLVLPVTAASAMVSEPLHPGNYSGSDGFYFVSFIVLVAYGLFVGLQVFEETRRLNRENKAETSLRSRLEQFKALISPFLPRQLVLSESAGRPSRKRITVFFSDIEGFTRLMDTADEMQVGTMLSSYFGGMSDIAARHGGTVDKFIGDGLLVFFGDPDTRGPAADALACVAMALEMRDCFTRLSADWQREHGIIRLALRMGISTGYCLVGEFGNETRKDYTVLGSVVNRASRLESAAAAGEILVSETTYRLVSPVVSGHCLGWMSLRGFVEPVKVFRISGLAAHGQVTGNVRLLN